MRPATECGQARVAAAADAASSTRARSLPVLMSPLLLLPLLLLAMPTPAHGYAEYFITHRIARACTDHPTTRLSLHGAPVSDTESSLSVQLDGEAVTTLCPGQTYNLTISLSYTCGILATTSIGTFSNTQGGEPCNNRFAISQSKPRHNSYTTNLTLPCSQDMPDDEVEIQVTTSDHKDSPFRQFSATFPVDAECTVDACVADPPPSPAAPEDQPHPAPAPPEDKPHPAPAPPGDKPSCPASFLGYACSAPTETAGVVLHWSTSGAMPANDCTRSAPGLPRDGMLHFAISSESSGMLGVGFPSSPGRMLHSDLAMGWVSDSGVAMAGAWSVPEGNYFYMRPDNTATWADFVAVSETTAAGVTRTVVCFSRRLENSAASTVLPTLDVSRDVDLIYAVGPQQYSFDMVHRVDGALAVNLGSGGAGGAAWLTRQEKLYIHAVLMSIAWLVLLPVGALLARHRWLSAAKTVVRGKQVWFWLHMGFQVAGFAVFVVGFAFAWEFLPGIGLEPTGGVAGKAHQVLGTLVMGLAVLQLVVGFVRPAPDDKKLRPAWSKTHDVLGRGSVLLAWVTVYLGIYIGHASPSYRLSYAWWLAPAAAVMGLLIAADVTLTVARARQERAGYAEAAPGDEVPFLRQAVGSLGVQGTQAAEGQKDVGSSAGV